eukprot:172078_1
MEFFDLTKEIYHGHEQEYQSIIPPLSVTDSTSSLPPAWLHTSQSSLATTNCKPLPLPYPRKKNDELDYSIRTQMNEFADYMNGEHPMESRCTSHITPYQSPKPRHPSHAITIKRHNRTKHIRSNNHNPFAYDRDRLSLNTKSISDKFLAINGSSQGANNEDIMRSNAINHYLSSSHSVSSFKLTEDAMEMDEGHSVKYTNLADLSIDEYEQYAAANKCDKDANNDDFIAHRDAIIKQYVECGDKVKGKEDMIALYLCRWREEEAQNITKIAYCFNGISDVKIHKKKKRSKHKTKSRSKCSKKKSKSSTQSKVRKSRKKTKKSNVIKPMHHKKLLHKRRDKKKKSRRHDSTGVLVKKHHHHKRKKHKKYSSDWKNECVFTFEKGNDEDGYVAKPFKISHSRHSKSLKTIYDRNKSMDLIDNNHIFKYGVNTPSSNGLKHERNQTMPYSSRVYEQMHKKEDGLFDALSYSLSPTPEPPAPHRMESMHYHVMNVHHAMSSRTTTNASSTTNTFHNTNSQFIPQPRASVVEKTFSWTDNDYNMRIMKPQ